MHNKIYKTQNTRVKEIPVDIAKTEKFVLV